MTLVSPGSRLGPYEIIESIGHGGMGDVYRARDVRLGRQVAIKTMTARARADHEFRGRFDREARAVASLSHPNILAIYDVGTHDGMPYIAMELLDGETLRARLTQSMLPLHTALEYAVQIGRGLVAAHDRGIVHRDLKPENVFITRDGQVKLLDFGIATEPAGDTSETVTRPGHTATGLALGTSGYMSPEQARGERIDPRSDIFSFGCVCYEMLTGRRPFAAGGHIETLHAILTAEPPDVTTLRADVPPALARVVRRCLEKARESRFQTARDLVFALEAPTGASPSGTEPAHLTAPPRRHASRMAIGAVVMLVVAGVSWTAWRGRVPHVSTRPAAQEDRQRVVAVLPFQNVSRTGDGYFAAGMTEEITSRLSKLGALRVIGRAAVAQFKDPRAELGSMAKELGVGSVVAGTVREEGGRVRVNVELIDAQSGQVIWSEQYDREGLDIFAAQSDIALRVGEALNASVTLDEQARLGRRPTSSVAAYELYVRANSLRIPDIQDRLRAAIDLLRQAVALDPKFAAAYSELANQYYFQGAFGDPPALARGLEAAHSAIALDPQLASAHRGLGLNLQQLGRLREALPAYHKAVELDPSYTSGLSDLAFGESTAGHFDVALRFALRAVDLTRNTPAAYYHAGVPLLMLDDDARTERFLAWATTRFPTSGRLQYLQAFLDLRRGQPQAAIARSRDAAEKAPKNIEALLTRAEIATFAQAPDAPALVRELLKRAADAPFHNAPYPVKLAHAYFLSRRGNSAEATAILEDVLAVNRKAIAAGADWPHGFLQIAAVHALRGERAASIEHVEKAYDAGWRDGRTLAIDPLLAPVRGEPRFKAVLARIEADVTAMRARADYTGLPAPQP